MNSTWLDRLFPLELPLMNLVYLTIPLLWLNGLSSGQETTRLWLMLLLGIFGGSLLSSIYVHRFKNQGSFSANRMALGAAGWFYTASLPAMMNFPLQVGFLGLLVGGVVRVQVGYKKKAGTDNRRFEIPALKKLLPLYAVYLLLILLWPTTLPFAAWRQNINFQALTYTARIVFIFRFVEIIAAFTLLGYMIAELRGRKNESLTKTLCWIFFITLSSSFLPETLRNDTPFFPANILGIASVTTASLCGGLIYRVQLAATGVCNFAFIGSTKMIRGRIYRDNAVCQD